MLCSTSFVVLMIGSLEVIWGSEPSGGKVTDENLDKEYLRELDRMMVSDENLARQWLRELDQMMEKAYNDAMNAAWNYNVNLTQENNQLQVGIIIIIIIFF